MFFFFFYRDALARSFNTSRERTRVARNVAVRRARCGTRNTPPILLGNRVPSRSRWASRSSSLRASQRAALCRVGHRKCVSFYSRYVCVCIQYAPRAPFRPGRLFSDSVLYDPRAHSALSLNTPTDLRNGWFPEQTRRWTTRESDEAENGI